MTDGRHALAEERSLALHRAVAERLRADPSLIERARRRVEDWLRDGTVARSYAEAWREVLAGPVDDVAGFLEDPGDRARRLRQASPFVEGSIGELSPFHETYGYYAQAVGRATAVLPQGWQMRLVPVPTPAGTGLCLEPHDLLLSKYAAGREKDREYVREAVRHRLADRATLLERLARMPISEGQRERISRQIEADFAT